MDLAGTVDSDDRWLTWNVQVRLSSNPAAPFGPGTQGCPGLSEGLQVVMHPLRNRQGLGQEVLHQRVWKVGKGFHVSPSEILSLAPKAKGLVRVVREFPGALSTRDEPSFTEACCKIVGRLMEPRLPLVIAAIEYGGTAPRMNTSMTLRSLAFLALGSQPIQASRAATLKTGSHRPHRPISLPL